MGNDHSQSFGETFASAHREQGAGGTFTYEGKLYSTDRADGRDLRQESVMTSNYQPRQSFGETFASAHREQGAGGTFTYGGNLFSTDRADGRDLRKESFMRSNAQPSRSSDKTLASSHRYEGNYHPQQSCSSAPVNRKSALELTSDKGLYEAAKEHVRNDAKNLKGMKDDITAAAKKTNIDPTIIAAVISRESNAGRTLDKNGYGDNGNAFGVMQVDGRYHNIDKSSRANHIMQGATILKDCIEQVAKKASHLERG